MLCCAVCAGVTMVLKGQLPVLALIGALIIPSALSECFFDAKAVCESEGEHYQMGDTWLIADRCLQCTCLHPFGVGCCNIEQQPIDYPEWCTAVRRPGSCRVSVVMKANRRVSCVYKSSWGARPGEGGQSGASNPEPPASEPFLA
uniref:Microseminoprotein, prostate associated n=1 Tax=Petromyzon marinus TaxID=7757 RepID=S4RA51_PETMA